MTKSSDIVCKKLIYTIGHSTKSLEEFIEMLQSFDIKCIADNRRYPGSAKYPWFNADRLSASLAEANISYIGIETLGGRRKPKADSKNTVWKNEAFRGYADYMETTDFANGISELASLASVQKTALLCSEAVWWRCHRSLVADYLKSHGWEVMHLMSIGKASEHPYTKQAKVVAGELVYGSA